GTNHLGQSIVLERSAHRVHRRVRDDVDLGSDAMARAELDRRPQRRLGRDVRRHRLRARLDGRARRRRDLRDIGRRDRRVGHERRRRHGGVGDELKDTRLRARRRDSRPPPAGSLAWHEQPYRARTYVSMVTVAGIACFAALLPLEYPRPLLFASLLAASSLTSMWKVNLPI